MKKFAYFATAALAATAAVAGGLEEPAVRLLKLLKNLTALAGWSQLSRCFL